MKEIRNDRELILSRLLNAPRELVFKVWTDPEHVVRWWGPTGFTNTNHGMDASKNGVWRFTMHGPDGVDYKNKIVFLEVKAPERIVYQHSDDEDTEQIHFRVTITFEPQGNQTNLTMHMIFDTPEEFEKVAREYGAIEGAHQHVARLEKYIASSLALETSPLPFTIIRHIQAPVDLVYEAFSKAEHLANWWGPKEMNVDAHAFDFRPGGRFLYSMTSDNGTITWGLMRFTDILPKEKIVFINSFADEHGNILPPPFPDPWPTEMHHIINLTRDQQSTKLILTSSPLHATDQERQTFIDGFNSMQEGYRSSFDQLDNYLVILKEDAHQFS
jgi:uncharacterized protein YndB with AHSA1/START domain